MSKNSKTIPDDMGELMEIFTQLCESYADEFDRGIERGYAQKNLLDFCHAYAYKVNGIKEWL